MLRKWFLTIMVFACCFTCFIPLVNGDTNLEDTMKTLALQAFPGQITDFQTVTTNTQTNFVVDILGNKSRTRLTMNNQGKIIRKQALPFQTIASTKSKLRGLKKFRYYLGTIDAAMISKMSAQQMVVVEPMAITKQQVETLRKKGTMVYGYVSLMEQATWNQALFAKWAETDFYQVEGERVHFSDWDSYLMNLTSSTYQDTLFEHIEQQIITKGLNGISFDTVGDLDEYVPEQDRISQKQAFVQFLQRIKTKYPNLSIGQNRGFQTLYDYTSTYMDFMIWENFSYNLIVGNQWSLNQITQLTQARTQYGVQVLAIIFADEVISKKLAATHKFKSFFNKNGANYNTW